MTARLNPCASFTHPECRAESSLAYTILPTEWGTGRVVYGKGPLSRLDDKVTGPDGKPRGVFGATTVMECPLDHSTAGGHKVTAYQSQMEPVR